MKRDLHRVIVALIFLYTISNFAYSLTSEPSIAVLGFINANQEAKEGNYGVGVAGMLTTALVNTGKFKVIERMDLQRILMEHKMGMDGIFDARTIKSLGKISGVKYVVVGSISRLWGLSEIDTRLLDTETGEILCAESGSCGADRNIRNTLETIASGIAKGYQTPIKIDAKKIAIFPFDDGSKGELIGNTVMEMITTYLTRNTAFKIVERANLDKILKEQKLVLSGIVGANTAKEIGKLLGLDAVILGNVTKFGEYFTVDARIIDIETGEITISESVDFVTYNLQKSPRETIEILAKKLHASYFGEGFLSVVSWYENWSDRDKRAKSLTTEVFLDRKYLGKSPISMVCAPIGLHLVEIAFDGWKRAEQEVNVPVRETIDLEVWTTPKKHVRVPAYSTWVEKIIILDQSGQDHIGFLEAGVGNFTGKIGEYVRGKGTVYTTEAQRSIFWVNLKIDNQNIKVAELSFSEVQDFDYFHGCISKTIGVFCIELRELAFSYEPERRGLQYYCRKLEDIHFDLECKRATE